MNDVAYFKSERQLVVKLHVIQFLPECFGMREKIIPVKFPSLKKVINLSPKPVIKEINDNVKQITHKFK
jgi:hypothetical protein